MLELKTLGSGMALQRSLKINAEQGVAPDSFSLALIVCYGDVFESKTTASDRTELCWTKFLTSCLKKQTLKFQNRYNL